MNEENIDGTNGCSKVRTGTQNEAALLALMEKTGYNMVQENGQRKFGGPPPGVDLFMFKTIESSIYIRYIYPQIFQIIVLSL